MNSLPLLDLAGVKAGTGADSEAAPLKTPEGGEAFGTLLDQASLPAEEEEMDAEPRPGEPAPVEEKKEAGGMLWAAAPPAFFFHVHQPPPKAPGEGEAVEGARMGDWAAVPAGNELGIAPEGGLEPADGEPKAMGAGPAPTKVEGVEEGGAAGGEKKPAMEGKALDLDVFEPFSEKTAPLTPAKPIESKEPPAPPPVDGTVVAKLDSRVRNEGKMAEIAPEVVQKMPTREVAQRVVPEAARIESFLASGQPAATPDVDGGGIALAEVEAPRVVEAANLVETIRTEVAQLRQRGEAVMTVVLKPDHGTELEVQVSIGRDGLIRAEARCERGDFQALQAQWPQLQQTLGAHGIRMTELSGQGGPGPEGFQNFEQWQDSRRESGREEAMFEEETSAARPGIRITKEQPQPAVAQASRQWQSWA